MHFAVAATILVADLSLLSPRPQACPLPGELTGYVGRYGPAGPHPEGIVAIALREGRLLVAPTFWRPPRILVPLAPDSFQMEDRADRTFVFQRDSAGCIRALRNGGVPFDQQLRRLGPDDTSAVERLVRGDGRLAAAQYLRSGADITLLTQVADRMLRVPGLRTRLPAFVEALLLAFPKSAGLHTTMGQVLIALDRRDEGIRHFRAALAVDSANSTAQSALERLGRRSPPAGGWRLPYRLTDLFAPPTPSEIQQVRLQWGRRDLGAHEVQSIRTRTIDLGHTRATARLVAHRVHGFRHFGVILVPEGATPGCCPVLIEAKGVSWNFPPLRIPDDLTSLEVLGTDQGRFIYVVPGLRGEALWLGNDSVQSEGDRSDAWDGATDDALALLSVALATTPEADSSRVCIFGRSRGGAVALLAGARDARIGCVVAWAAPTDWFQLMGLGGWTQQELAADGLAHRATPRETGGQFINYFLSPTLAGRRDLRETRLHLIASSPLYFADRLPPTQAHWGMDDAIVPIRNGEALAVRARAGTCFQWSFHAGAGHDQDLFDAPRKSREFLRAVADQHGPFCGT